VLFELFWIAKCKLEFPDLTYWISIWYVRFCEKVGLGGNVGRWKTSAIAIALLPSGESVPRAQPKGAPDAFVSSKPPLGKNAVGAKNCASSAKNTT
jgi:hypothetical protein